MFTRSLALLSLGSALLLGCSNKQDQSQSTTNTDTAKVSAAPVKEGQGKGILKGIDTTTKLITLDHNNIPGVMEAMAMDYHVDKPELLHAAKIGDSVAFTLQDRGEGNFVVTTIAPIAK